MRSSPRGQMTRRILISTLGLRGVSEPSAAFEDEVSVQRNPAQWTTHHFHRLNVLCLGHPVQKQNPRWRFHVGAESRSAFAGPSRCCHNLDCAGSRCARWDGMLGRRNRTGRSWVYSRRGGYRPTAHSRNIFGMLQA